MATHARTPFGDETVDVLVVDDEPSVCGFIARVLARNGYTSRTAGDTREAMAAVSQRIPTLAICDVRMPGNDGKWLLRELKKRWPQLPVIMLSAVAEARTAVECLKAGATDYLVKPIDLDELIGTVSRATEMIQFTRTAEGLGADHVAHVSDAFRAGEDRYGAAASLVSGRVEPGVMSNPVAFRQTIPPQSAVPADDALQSVELAALRVAGKLMAQRESSTEVGAAVCRELVHRGPFVYATLWSAPIRGAAIEAIAEFGHADPHSLEIARLAISTGKSQCQEASALVTVACPIVVGDGCEAVLQLACESTRRATVVDLAERLALLIRASLMRETESRDRERTVEELDLFHRLAGASRHSLDLEHVAEFLFASLHRIVDYQVAGLLILEDEPYLSVRTRFPADDAFAQRVRSQVLNTLRITCGVEVSEGLRLHVEELPGNGRKPVPPDQLRSFINVPFSVGGRVVGLIHVSRARDQVFTQEEVASLNRSANFLASSVQGVRDLLGAVKGRVERMVDHMTDGVLMLDRRGRVVAMNGAARGLLAPNPADTSGDATSLAGVLDFDPLAVLDGQRSGAKRLICVHGVAYQAQLSAVVDDAGELTGAVLALRDFDDEKRADEMKSEIVNVVSHELRTPLTAIRNGLFLLSQPKMGELSAQQRRFLELVHRNTEQLMETVNDLLDLSKIEAGRMEIQLEPVRLSDPLRAAVVSMGLQAEDKNVALELREAPDLPEIHAHAASLRRVLVNLIGNSIKYTQPQGKVTVHASLVMDDGDGPSRPAVKVSVSDSGVGVPRDQLQSIFDKYRQAQRPDGAGPKVVVGTGLGLSICRELVKAHYGRIWAESEEGVGSRFSFVIPVLDETELFFLTLGAEIVRAEQQRSRLVLAIVHVQNGDQLRDTLGAPESSNLLHELLDSVRSVLRRSGDRVLLRQEEGQIAVVLPRTSNDGGRVFETRLIEEIRKSSVSQKNVELSVGYAVYPDDAATAEQLYFAAETGARDGVSV